MLTPQEISSKEFVKAVFGGYDMSAVDEFLELLTADYTALYKENAILKSKIKVLVEKVEEYRTTDDAMRMALLTAQRLGEEITAEAKKKSEEMLSQTERDIRDRINEMKSKFTEEENRLKSVKEETRKFITISQEIVRQHNLFLGKLEGLNKQQEPEAAPVKEAEYIHIPEQEPEIIDPIDEAARQIDDALDKITESDEDPFASLYPVDDVESQKVFQPRQDPESVLVGEPTSPRPKFDFNNLKFGANYSGD